MLERIYLNKNWRFSSQYTDSLLDKGYDDKALELVSLPHTVVNMPLNYFDESIYQMVSGYRRCFVPEVSWEGKHVFMTVGAAGHSAEVYHNGNLIATHKCGYTSFTVDLSPTMIYGDENILVIKVDSREQQNLPPFGHVIDYMTFGGLYRDVYLEIKDVNYIEDVFVRTEGILEGKPCINCDITLKAGNDKHEFTVDNQSSISQTLDKKNLILRQTITDDKGNVEKLTDNTLTQTPSMKIVPWDLNNPKLYTITTELVKENKVIDSVQTRVGFRSAEFKSDGFYLNGIKIKIRGLNRHQSFPYVGYAMPKSMQRYDAEILKNELKVNAVRTSHYPQSHHFIDRCDELGILVFTEMPGWQYIGDEAWQEQAVQNTKEMVLQYRNHPSIILWGVRINESPDNDAFYTKTNEMAHSLDNTRQTSGVRCIKKSSLLEDVYAFNDFSHEGNNAGCLPKRKVTTDMNKGYFISEYGGHMFPTKTFDCEDHRVEHMLRHARVVDAYYSHDDIAGGFAWCMFDYNTHQDFGSGDRVCYHGVCDMFRNPKLAAAVYSSQQDEESVLEISSSMDIGEHPACLMKDVYAITNADSVKLYKNDMFVREFKRDDTSFHNMPHGPILIDDFIGELMEKGEGFSKAKSEDVKSILMSACRNGMSNLPISTLVKSAKCVLFRGMKPSDAVELYNKYIGNWGGTATVYRYEAIKDGNVVKTIVKRPMTDTKLEVRCSHNKLIIDETYDVAAVRIKAVSENNNVLEFCHAPIALSVSGPIEIIGPKLISLQGGMGGTYIRTTGEPGNASLSLKSEIFDEVVLNFEIVNNESFLYTLNRPRD